MQVPIPERASHELRFTLPWRGRVAASASERRGGVNVGDVKVTPPRLATASLADPPPPGEGGHRAWG